jgi:hypothetical protein
VGLFDRFRGHAPEERRELRVEFLGEQDGVPERALKAAITPILAADPTIARAYLARVGFQPSDQGSVALCVAGPVVPSPAVLREVQLCFGTLFRTGAALDILALSAEQDSDARRVCSPFYVRTV